MFSTENKLIIKIGIYNNPPKIYINKKGNIVIKPQFDDAKMFSDGAAIIMKNGSYGLIDYTGKYIISPRYMIMYDIIKGLTVIRTNNDRYGLIDKKTKKIIIQIQYDNIFQISGSDLAISQKDKEGSQKIGVLLKMK